MFDVSKVPFKILMAAEKIVGKNIMELAQKENKTFEDLRDFAFVVKYSQDSTFTLKQADELCIEQLNELTKV